jgi:glycosyltransferase involved in cell wall biosynthesis
MLYARLTAAGLPVIPLSIHNHFDVLAGLRLRRFVQTHQYDVVHFHTARAHALSPWLHSLPVRRIVTRRMDYALKKSWFNHLLYHRSVDMIVAISLGVRTALLNGGVPATHIRLIPSGIDTTRFSPDPAAREQVRSRYGMAPHLPLVLSVGALVERKGHGALLAAAHSLKQKGYDIRYFICGDGPLRSVLETQARTLQLTHEVRFTGFCSEIQKLYAAADFFVHVPLHEGLGVAVIEALAAGLPTVASKVGGIPELIEHEKTGILIPPRDGDTLAAALAYLLENRPWGHQIGTAGQIFVRNHFDMKAMARANEALYVELLADTS